MVKAGERTPGYAPIGAVRMSRTRGEAGMPEQGYCGLPGVDDGGTGSCRPPA